VLHAGLFATEAALAIIKQCSMRTLMSCRMKQLPRYILAASVVASCVLFAAMLALWVRSHVLRDYAFAWLPWPAHVSDGQRLVKLDLDSGGGQLEVSWKVWTTAARDRLSRSNSMAAENPYHRTFPDVPKRYARSDPPTIWNALGFKRYSGPTHSSICFPYWLAVILTAAAPAWFIAGRIRRRRRIQSRQCLSCGYDLRATPDRCPECGAAATT
jgi:hypothetical protein